MSHDDAGEGWNHNIHYHRVVLDAVRPGDEHALDVGCGGGELARALARIVPHVTAIDSHGPTLAGARAQGPPGIEYVDGDVLTHPFEPGWFDLVSSIAVLHHLDGADGLARMRDLVRPGGTLIVVGLARARYPRDLPHDVAGSIANRYYRSRRTFREVDAPMVWPPPATYTEARDVARRVLPGVEYRRHLQFRYSLTWVKPG